MLMKTQVCNDEVVICYVMHFEESDYLNSS